jgi:P-type Ca2+ transporter type 2C
VLVDDEFSSLVQGIRMGRRVFGNLKKAMAFALAIHVPIAVVSLVPVLLGLPLILLPVHIVFMEFITDPACSIAFEAEPEEVDVMTRPPRDPREPLFSPLIGLSLLQGASVAAIVMAVFALALHYGRSQDEARALTIASLVMGDLGLVLTNRSWTRTIWGTLGQRNPALWWLFAWTGIILGLILYVPFLRGIFSFDWISPRDLLLCVGAAAVAITWFEALKLVRSWRRREPLAAG